MLEPSVHLHAPSGSARNHALFLFEVSGVLTRSDAPPVLCEAFAGAAAAIFCDACVVHLAGEAPSTVVSIARTSADAQAPIEKAFELAVTSENGFVQEALRSDQALRFDRNAARNSFVDEAAARVLHATAMRSMIVVPIADGSKLLGSLSFLQRSDDAAFAQSDVQCAIAAGRQLSMAVENAILHERERRIVARARLLGEATDRLFSTVDEFEMIRRLLDVVVEQFADWALAVSVSGDGLIPLATACAYDADDEVQRFSREYLLGAGRGRILELIRLQEPLLQNGRPAWMMAPLFAGGREYGAVFCHVNSRLYEPEDLEALRELCRRTSLALEYANSFARERRLAQTLARATLPSNLPAILGARVDVGYQPAAQEEQVGGDWYDLFPLGEDRVLASIGDVTGHGLAAWTIMAKLRHSLNVVAKYETDPARMLDVVEEIVLQRFPEVIATAFLAILDTRAGTVSYANAGHPAPKIRRRNGSIEELPANGLPIGVRRLGPPARCETATLRDADLVVFYTDGLIESTRNAVDGERWLVRGMQNDAALLTIDSAAFLSNYCLRGPVPDDVAVLTLNFAPMPRWSFDSSDQRAAQEARDEFCAILRRNGATLDDCAASELIFGELIGNVARHAPGPVEVALETRHDRAVLHVIDRGAGYRIARLVRADVLDEDGRGLWLVSRLGGSLQVEPIPGFGTHTAVTLPGRMTIPGGR